jgi:hypothetical protein
MSVHESERRRSQQRHQHRRRKLDNKSVTLDAPLNPLHDDQVLTFDEWCRLNRISERTGHRIIDSGQGPVITDLSTRRIGITVANNRRWQASRARS